MADFEQYLKPGKRGHLIGAGGVSMAPLAEVLAGMGLVIDGSDMAESDKTRYLRSLGIDIKIGHSAMNVAPDIQFVVRTAAVHDDNPEIVEARARGVPVFERAQAWGAIMKDYDNALCIAGTHGKTTTTSMCTHILMAAERDPTVMIGGTLPLLHAGHRVGGGDTIILESCEYHDSFLYFCPTIAVILDIEEDHMDYFSDLEDVKHSFREFASRVPANGRIVANIDDRNTMDALAPLDRELFTFGLTDKADVYARNIRRVGANSEFDIYCHGKLFTSVTLHIPGMHNVKNALAATAACICLGVRPNAVKYGLAGFNGAGRRFEFKGKFNGADVYDDYAHHPTEIRATLNTAKELGYNRVIAVHQPFTYSRTKMLFNDFVDVFKIPDITVITPIMGSREPNDPTITSAKLAAQIPNSVLVDSLEAAADWVKQNAREGDLVITLGCGDIYKASKMMVKKD